MKRTAITIMVGIAVGIGGFWIWRDHLQSVPGHLLPSASIVENARAFILPIAQTTYYPIRNFSIPDPLIDARAVILVDGTTHRVLFAKNADQRLPIASITKLMSAMVILDHLDLTIPYRVSAEDRNLDGGDADFREGEEFRGTELFKIMLIKSSNDAVSVFASTAYRQGFDFVDLMNQKARLLGMMDTHFSDPAGLDDVGTYSTASDVVAMVQAAEKYPLIVAALLTPEEDIATIDGHVYRAITTNQLLATIPDIAIAKTGNTTGALGTMALAGRVNKNGDEVISVILGSEQRFAETATLLQWGKQAHKWEQL